jgi:hypothetical protein
MAENMGRYRQLYNVEKRSLERRLGEEILLREALMVTLNDDQEGIQRLIEHYEKEKSEQGHQFELAFAAIQEDKRILDLKYEELLVRCTKNEALMNQLDENLTSVRYFSIFLNLTCLIKHPDI